MAGTPFKLRSGNTTPFKHMGKHPAKDGHTKSNHKKIRQTKKDSKALLAAAKKGISINEDMIDRDKLKAEGKTVEKSRKLRKKQNRLNIISGSKVRHTKPLGILSKYKKKIVESDYRVFHNPPQKKSTNRGRPQQNQRGN